MQNICGTVRPLKKKKNPNSMQCNKHSSKQVSFASQTNCPHLPGPAISIVIDVLFTSSLTEHLLEVWFNYP